MSNLSNEQLAALRAEFQKDPLGRSATDALLGLITKGCDPMVIQGYTGRIAGYKSGNFGMFRRGVKETARKLRGIKRQLKKLAKRTTELSQTWGFWSRMVQADCIHIPAELEAIAGRLSRVKVGGYADWHPQREAILDLLEHVYSSTGRYHYTEVSVLINAEIAWRALKAGKTAPEIRQDVDSLKMIVQRWRREYRVKLAKSADPAIDSNAVGSAPGQPDSASLSPASS